MKYYVIAELRENHTNLLKQSNIYNDYVSEKSMMQLVDAINKNGYNCEFLVAWINFFHYVGITMR